MRQCHQLDGRIDLLIQNLGMMQPAQHIDAELAAAARQHWLHCVLPDRKPFAQLLDLLPFAHAQLADRRNAYTVDFLPTEKHLPCGRGSFARPHGSKSSADHMSELQSLTRID